MQTINIHDVKSITLSEIYNFEKTSTRGAFSVRHLTIIDKNDYKIDIELYSDDAKDLKHIIV